ncbi:hypothetical protein [Streptomyces sp. NPDC056982]|uniref:hypothetical protein n=1 Tax=Streptomyces sp. NPDC056982 TaxID=3345986 RepID=UPI00362532D3
MTDPFSAALTQATRTVMARARGELPASTATVVAEKPGGKIAHSYCCDENTALCGLELTGTPEVADDEQDCVVCVDLDENGTNCPLCADPATA